MRAERKGKSSKSGGGGAETPVVTCFLKYKGKYLILKRSERVLTSKGKWAGVAGYVESGERPLETALKEIKEETGIENPRLLKEGKPFLARTDTHIWKIHPFLFEVDTDRVAIDWEHTEYRWIGPEELKDFDTAPSLDISLQRVLS